MKPNDYVGAEKKRGGAPPGAMHSAHVAGARRRIKVGLTVDPDLYEQVRKMAEESRITVSALFEFLFKQALNKAGIPAAEPELLPPLAMVANGRLGRKR